MYGIEVERCLMLSVCKVDGVMLYMLCEVVRFIV
jgi:hypothetical protein